MKIYENKAYTDDEWEKIEKAKQQYEYYDLLQLTKKIQLNSLYGALLNKYFRFGDERMGASTTATGRQVTTHMVDVISRKLDGNSSPLIKTDSLEKGKQVTNYDTASDSILYGDTDSFSSDTLVDTDVGLMTVEVFFNMSDKKMVDGDREVGTFTNTRCVRTLEGDTVSYEPIKYVYRHRVNKPKWKVTLSSGKSIIVTGDHSIMVIRNDNLISVKTNEIKPETDRAVVLRQ